MQVYTKRDLKDLNETTSVGNIIFSFFVAIVIFALSFSVLWLH